MKEPFVRELKRFRLFGRVVVIEYEGGERPAIRRVSQRAIVPAAVPIPDEPTKICPYCAETIKAAAIVCRFCNRDLGAPVAIPVVPVTPARSLNIRTLAIVGIGVCLLAFYFLSALGRDVPLSPTSQSCASQSPAFIKAMDGLTHEWQDAYTLATKAPRVGVASQIETMQSIRRRVGAVDAPACGKVAQTALVTAMDATIDGFIAFLGQADEADIQAKFTIAATKFEQATKEINKLGDVPK